MCPQTPGNRSTRPLVHARMDNEPAHTTRAWTALRVRSFPTLETVAPPVDRQAAHRGLALPGGDRDRGRNTGWDLSPLGMQDGGGLELGESFAQAVRFTDWELSPRCWTSQGHHIGAGEPTEALRSRVHGLYHPSTRSRHHCLSVAIWEGFPLYRLLHAGPAENQ